MAAWIKEDMTATGPTIVASVRACDFVVGGPFVGDWELQALLNDEWVKIVGASIIGTFPNIIFAEPRQLRFMVTGFLGGKLRFNLAGRVY